MESVAISDIAVRYPNPVVAIPNVEAMQVFVYVPDTTKPYLVNFTVDLSTESITLNFSEPVRPSTLDVTQITLASAPISSPFAIIGDVCTECRNRYPGIQPLMVHLLFQSL